MNKRKQFNPFDTKKPKKQPKTTYQEAAKIVELARLSSDEEKF